jgi:hypothetical protein
VVKCERNRGRLFKIRAVSISPATEKKRGGVMSTESNIFPEPQGFSGQDILWALGVWSVILGLSPVIIFYMLMVA